MGRRISINRKRNDLKLRGLTSCQWRYLTERAEMETVKKGVVVGLSGMAISIIRERMALDGYICEA